MKWVSHCKSLMGGRISCTSEVFPDPKCTKCNKFSSLQIPSCSRTEGKRKPTLSAPGSFVQTNIFVVNLLFANKLLTRKITFYRRKITILK